MCVPAVICISTKKKKSNQIRSLRGVLDTRNSKSFRPQTNARIYRFYVFFESSAENRQQKESCLAWSPDDGGRGAEFERRRFVGETACTE